MIAEVINKLTTIKDICKVITTQVLLGMKRGIEAQLSQKTMLQSIRQ